MSTSKIVVIVIITTIILFALLIYMALSPTIRDVSHHAALRPFLNKQLTLKRNAILFYCEGIEYRFIQHALREEPDYPCEKKQQLSTGKEIVLQKFKTYKNASSGFTHLYALGTLVAETGETIPFEYDWGTVDLEEFAGKEPLLPRAIWQGEHADLVKFSN
jgi:hypothetical protein